MVKVQEYKPDQFMINVTKEEALRLIKSLAAQLYNDNCNTDRVEFGKRHEDDVEYFSIAVDEYVSEFHVLANVIFDGYNIREIVLTRKKTLKESQEFIKGIEENVMVEYELWIKEVSI